MHKEKSNFIDELVAIKEAFTSRDEVKVSELLDKSESHVELSRSVRFGLTNYQAELEGGNFTEVSTIWAIPVLIPKSCNHFVSTSGNPIKLFDSASRMMVRKAFGAEYKIAAFEGLIHADVLTGMPYIAQAALLGKIAGDQRYESETVCMEVQQSICERIEAGEGAELCFMVGSATRYNRTPQIPKMSGIRKLSFDNELKGRISINCKSDSFDHRTIRLGPIATLAEAYEVGSEMLLSHMSEGRTVGLPAISCTSSSNLIIRVGFYKESSDLLIREFPFNTALISMDSVENLFNYVKRLSNDLPVEVQKIISPAKCLH